MASETPCTSSDPTVVCPCVPGIVIVDFDTPNDHGTLRKIEPASLDQKMTESEEDKSCSGPSSATSTCLLCPVHCSTAKNQLPKQNGLYGKIAELMNEIQQRRKSYSTDKAALMKRIEELEAFLSATKDKNLALVSQNHLLESKVKSLQKWASSTSKAGKNESKWLFKDTIQDVVPKRSSLRRTKSQEIVGFRQGSIPGGSLTGISNVGQERKTSALGLAMQSDTSISSSRLNLMAPIQEADEDSFWAKERELLLQSRQIYTTQIRELEKQNRRLQTDLQDAHEQVELLEFRLLELEEHCSPTKNVIDAKQFNDQCIGTDNSPSPEVCPEEWPENKGDICEFRDEKIHELKSRILEIVRLYPVTSVDKTTLVQAVAILELCHKLISSYRSEKLALSDSLTVVPGVTAKMESVNSKMMEHERPSVEPSQHLIQDILLTPKAFSAALITGTHGRGDQLKEGHLESESIETECIGREVSYAVLKIDEHLTDSDTCSGKTSNELVVCRPAFSTVTGGVCNGRPLLPKQHERLVSVVNPTKTVIRDNTTVLDPVFKICLQPWSSEVDDHSLENDATSCDPSDLSFSENEQSIMQVELKRLEELLKQAYCELRSKETEYCIKMEALKCDKEDCIGLLEQKLCGLQEREFKIRSECEELSSEKLALEEKLKDQTLKFEWQKEDLLKKLEESHQEIKKMKERRESSTKEAAVFGTACRELDLSNKLEEAKLMVCNHKETIARLKNCLNSAVAEVDSALACSGRIECRSVQSDEERLLFSIKELTNAESEARQRLGRLEKKEAAYRETLDEADRIMADVEHNYQERLDEMEQSEQQLRKRIQYLEQSERRLNEMLKESSSRRHPEVRKVGELLERLMEVEASELLLRERLMESTGREEEAKGRQAVAEEARRVAERQLEEQEDLLHNLEALQRNERTLLNRIAELEISESALQETLRNADNILTTREQRFIHTIEKLQTEVNVYKNKQLPSDKTINRRVTEKPSEVVGMMAELQQLNDREADLESLRGSLSEIVASITVCPRCHPLCTPTLNHLESQVQQLHEIVFGNRNSMIDTFSTGPYSQPAESESEGTTANVFSNYVSAGVLSPDSEVDALDNGDFQMNQCPEIGQQSATGDPCQQSKMYNSEVDDAMTAPSSNRFEEEGENCVLNAELSNLALQISHLQEENEELKRNLWRSESALQAAVSKTNKLSEEMEVVQKRNGDLATKVNFLNRQLRHSEDVQQEKDRLQHLLNGLEGEMQKKKEEEHRLCAENLHLRHKVESLRERLGSLQLLKKDHKALLSKCTTLEKKIRNAESSFVPIQQQNSNLLRECWEKDQIIEKLGQELNCMSRNNEHPNCFCGSLRPLKTHSVSQSSDDSGIRDCSGSCSLESEISEDCILDSSSCGQASEDSRSTSPASSSHRSSYHSSVMNGRLSPLSALPSRKGNRPSSTKECVSRIPRYTALNKQNGSAHVKAENVTSKWVTDGKPSSRIGPLVDDPSSRTAGKKLGHDRRPRLSSADAVTNSMSTAIAKNKVSAEKPPLVPTRPVSRVKASSVKPVLMKTFPLNTTPAAPDAPSNFRVTRRVGHDSLVVAWNTPVMDVTGCSNGCTVSGYQIFVNGILHQNVRSAHRTKALLNNLDFSNNMPMEISIQALSLTGHSSALEVTQYNGNEAHIPLPDKTTARSTRENVDRKCLRSETVKDIHVADKGKLLELRTLQGYFSPLGRLVEV